MKFHREGRVFILMSFLVFCTFTVLALVSYSSILHWGLAFASMCLFLFILRFFRFPQRPLKQIPGTVLSPCDGRVVIVEEVEEPEYFKDKRLQISVFMSPNNVHINWAPVSGVVDYYRYHPGKYLVAWHPKSSTKNERTTFVVNTGSIQVLFRQIAGCVARRIVAYPKEGDKVQQNDQIGFIKFGSRMDIFLPVGTKICVKVGDAVVGTESVLAEI